MVVGILRLQYRVARRHTSSGFHIIVHFIVQAALELGAHAGELLGIERHVLEAGSVGAHADEVLHPCGTAQFAAAGSCSTDAPSLLPRTYLLHFDAHMEGSGEVFDELSEVYTFVGDVVEDGLIAVALIFHVTNLHLQAKAPGYLSALDHRVVLAGLRLTEFLHVYRLGDAIDTLDVVGRPKVYPLQLQLHEAARQRDRTDVMPRAGLNGHHVAFRETEFIDVMIISLARVLKLYLHEVGAFGVSGHVGQPVICVELPVLPPTSFMAEAAVAARCHLEFHILEVHTKSLLSY